MTAAGEPRESTATRWLDNGRGLRIECFTVGGAGPLGLGRIEAGGVTVNLFPGNRVEPGPGNLWLRRHGPGGVELLPLLGPGSPLHTQAGDARTATAAGHWHGLGLALTLQLSAQGSRWFWHLAVRNEGPQACTLDLVLVQDVGLAPYGAIRTNEHYVSHYVDLTPLAHPARGTVLAARQNLAVAGRQPWALMGSLRRAVAFATDAGQVQGLAVRAGRPPQGLVEGLPSQRLQQEHALIGLQDEPLTLAPGESAWLGFFAHVQADHPAATGPDDLAAVGPVLALPEARLPEPDWPAPPRAAEETPASASLFVHAPWLPTQDLGDDELDRLFGPARRHAERAQGQILSFFTAADVNDVNAANGANGANGPAHVVLRAKELQVQRPHGHILRSGRQLVPDESALTSTVWMAGGFHSMLTQGHVSINRLLSTARGMHGLYRSTGQRVFVEVDGRWQQLGLPSAFVIEAERCRWLYRSGADLLEVIAAIDHARPAMTLQVHVHQGPPRAVLVTHHLALGGDDGRDERPVPLQHDGRALVVPVPAGSELAARFPQGRLRLEPLEGTHFDAAGGDEMLFADGASRGLPFACVRGAPGRTLGLRLVPQLVPPPAAAATAADPAPELPLLAWPGASGPYPAALDRLADILPWFRHNALVHYLAPRGLEQYSGGGWGTRDVCQGPLEMLLALDRPAPVRDLLCRTFAAQNPDGDWPQWFMFFERERDIRAGDSHGDIVFWPLLGLAQYLLASGDATLLDEALPFHAPSGAAPEVAPLRAHVARALAVIRARRIAGTALAAYGHGDWNDSLQPADPALREHLCSAWTVTLHHQTLVTLAQALQTLGATADAAPLRQEAEAIARDFQRLLVRDGVVAGYAHFGDDTRAAPRLLLHPSDTETGVHHSLLPMMHAVLDDLLTPAQAQAHLALIREHLLAPDGARLFDRPLPYRGGPQRLFQRAESSAYFGREIGVMYMHAHLRYAQMLAHLGQAEAFFEALALAHPIALGERVGRASPRQANCYYSSSDAAFPDRYEAQAHYDRIARGEVALDGGWRIYSSGPGLAIAIVVRHFLGWRRGHETVVVDPVIPPALDGLQATLGLDGRPLRLRYRLGPAGCGVRAVAVGGQALPFERDPNPYRTGGARVTLAALRAALAGGADELVVTTD